MAVTWYSVGADCCVGAGVIVPADELNVTPEGSVGVILKPYVTPLTAVVLSAHAVGTPPVLNDAPGAPALIILNRGVEIVCAPVAVAGILKVKVVALGIATIVVP